MEQAKESTDSIVSRIRATTDAKEKLAIAGLIREPFKEAETKEECGNCIYFLPNHRFCDMPALEIPVEPHWWCRLWRV